jgi:hypothetical protein
MLVRSFDPILFRRQVRAARMLLILVMLFVLFLCSHKARGF